MKKIAWIFALTALLTACGGEKEDEKKSDDKAAKESESVENDEDISLCDCMLLTIEVLKESGSDPTKIDYDQFPKLLPCKKYEDMEGEADMAKAMEIMKECPEIVMKMQELYKEVDMGSLTEKLRESNPDFEDAMKKLQSGEVSLEELGLTNSDDIGDLTCDEYLEKYDQFSQAAVIMKKKLEADPKDMDAIQEFSKLGGEMTKLAAGAPAECVEDEAFQTELQAIADKYKDDLN